jgi:hypothetical protein
MADMMIPKITTSKERDDNTTPQVRRVYSNNKEKEGMVCKYPASKPRKLRRRVVGVKSKK